MRGGGGSGSGGCGKGRGRESGWGRRGWRKEAEGVATATYVPVRKVER